MCMRVYSLTCLDLHSVAMYHYSSCLVLATEHVSEVTAALVG